MLAVLQVSPCKDPAGAPPGGGASGLCVGDFDDRFGDPVMRLGVGRSSAGRELAVHAER